MTILLGEEKEKILDKFLAVGESLSHDWFTEYFQTEHGDRKNLKQDYTPDSVAEISAKLLNAKGLVADLCAGSGGLTIKAWTLGAKEFYCLEFSERVIPILLLNLVIRNIRAIVVHGDALTKETFKAYQLIPGEKYSDIEIIEDDKDIQNIKVDSVITNPPYSLKWTGQRNFQGYETPPASKADYAFILDGLERLKDGGSLVAILPHGVLFRGAKEGKIRQKLLENRMFETIIGLPDKLFLNTDIPVAVIKWQKNSKDLLFIDASKELKKIGRKTLWSLNT